MDTNSFNERVLAKSRAVCERIEREDAGSRVGLTERERAILDMWPRFEDGEYVWFGDELVHKEQGHRFHVEVIEVMNDGWRACCRNNGVRDVFRPGERVKRPAPKVLDADGVEINVGDTVFANATDRGDGREWTVTRLDLSTGYSVTARDRRGEVRDLVPKWLTHTRPDSWRRLEEDIQKSSSCAYFGFDGKDCCGCPAYKPGNCSKFKALDIVRRAKALAGVGE